MINVEKSDYSCKYDNDLINILLLIEKIENQGYKNIISLTSSSLRKDYILNDDNTLKYFKNINYSNWKTNEFISQIDIKIIMFMDNLLSINPDNRRIQLSIISDGISC